MDKEMRRINIWGALRKDKQTLDVFPFFMWGEHLNWLYFKLFIHILKVNVYVMLSSYFKGKCF